MVVYESMITDHVLLPLRYRLPDRLVRDKRCEDVVPPKLRSMSDRPRRDIIFADGGARTVYEIGEFQAAAPSGFPFCSPARSEGKIEGCSPVLEIGTMWSWLLNISLAGGPRTAGASFPCM